MDIDGLDSFSKILFAERPINNKLVSSLFFHLLGIMLNVSVKSAVSLPLRADLVLCSHLL